MRSMTFLVNDRSTGGRIPAVAVTITENSDGSLSFELKVIGPYTGDLRGFFFDLAEESRIGTLSVTPTSPGFTEFRQGNDSIKDLGNGANMQGLLGSDGGYDAGIEIGSAGIGKDDYQSFSFTLASSAGPLTLEDFSNVDFGLRLTSVGFDRWGGRDGGVKLLEHTSGAIDAIDDANAVDEDESPDSVGGNVFANDLNLDCAHLVTAVNGSAWNVGHQVEGIYGTLRLKLDGSYTYTLDNTKPAVQALAEGQQVTETFSYTAKSFDEFTSFSTDSAFLRVTITGANDAPEIAGDTTGEVFEDGSRHASGQLVGSDPDANSELTWSVVGSGPMTPVADYRFLLDNLNIVRDGLPFFNDDFGSGGPPPAAPAFNYFTFGTFLESGGRAIMDAGLGAASSLPIPGAPTVIAHFATLATDTGPDVAQGLKRTQQFKVEARYDLVMPDEERENYAVRLSDGNNDIVEVCVRRMEDGSVAVALREVDVPFTVPVIRDFIALEPAPGDQQIVLRLEHAANTNLVTASFDLLNGGVVTHSETLAFQATIFSNEDWTRAQVIAQSIATPQNGVYGTLSVEADGEWHYSLNNAAANVQALAQGEHVTDTFAVTVTDEHGASDTETVTIDVAGSNDIPMITGGTNSGFVVEDFIPTASGQLSAFDPDHGAVLRWSAGPSSSLPFPGIPNAFQFFGYSSDYRFTVDQFTIERNGVVIFDDPFSDGIAPPSAPAFSNGVPGSYLANGGYTEFGDRLHLDGEFATVLRGIANPNLLAGHAAVLLTNIDPADLTRGLKSDDDFTVEARFDLAVPGAGQAYGISLTDGTFGGLPADRIGDSNVNLLVRPGPGGGLVVQFNDFDNIADSATVLESVAFSPEPGENQVVLRLVHDADEPGLVHAEFDLLGAVGGPRTFELTGTGHIFGSGTPGYAGDDENWTRAQIAAFGPDTGGATFQGTYGILSVEQNGVWNYTLDNGAPSVQALAQGEFAQDVISVRVADEHGLSSFRPVFIGVQGSNDPVVMTGGNTNGAVEEDTVLAAAGTVAFTDADLADFHSAFFTPAPTNGPALGSFSLGFVDELPNTAGGSVSWSYNLDNAAAQFLAQGQTVFETYTVMVQDFWGSFATQDVTIAIIGRDEVVGNNPPDITGGTTSGQVYEDGAARVARGQLTAFDPDPGAMLTWSLQSLPAFAGSVNVDPLTGQWTYTLNNGLPAVQQLAQGESVPDAFTVRVTDEHGAFDTQTVTIDVTGTGDRPFFTTPTPVLIVSEDGGFVSGQTSAFDVDRDLLHWSLNRGSVLGYFSDYEFRADSFSVSRDGAQIFHDPFDGDGAPPLAPNFGNGTTASYGTTGQFMESGGKLVMRGDNALAFRGTGNDALVVGNEAILATNVDPANTVNGLKKNHQFVVEGVFDLIEPGQPRQAYGLTLTDGVNQVADDLLSLVVARDPADGHVYVRFNNSSSVLDTLMLVERDLLVAGAADQIRLRLTHEADSGDVSASYELLDDGDVIGSGSLGQAGIFGTDTPLFAGDDENWIRAGLFSNGMDPGEFTQTLAGAYGTLTVDNSEVNTTGQLVYTPGPAAQALAQGESVVDTFFVRVIDPQGMSNPQRVDVTVTGFNDPPMPMADRNSVVEDVVIRAVGNVLANDSDVDHGSVLTIFNPGSFDGDFGTLTLNLDGSYVYQLDHGLADFLAEGQVVNDRFEGVYGITDGAITNHATLLEIEITGTGETPVPLAGEVFEDGSRSASGQLAPEGAWSIDNPGTLANPAYRFLIDNFRIVRNNTELFNDGFDGGGPPPSAPNFANGTSASYQLNGSFIETGGRVILDGSRSVEVEGIGSPGPRFATSARLLTDNSTDLTRGLKFDDSFTVEGRFDLVLDLDPGDNYGVRLNDSGGGVTGSDIVQAVVRRDAGGNLEVALVELDGPSGSSITLQSIALEPLAGENQIVLKLAHDPLDPGVVEASFDLLGGPAPRSFSFTAVGHIFGTGTPGDPSDDEVWTRAEFRASADGAMQNGVYGTLSIDSDGGWDYLLNNAAANVQALAQGERASDTFLVRHGASDTEVLRIDVVGTDDAPANVNIGFASFFQGGAGSFIGTYVIEDSAQQVTRGHAFATDVDHGASLQWSVSPVTIVPTGPSSFQVFGYSSDYHFAVDQLTIERNGVVIFDDPFSDGFAPPSAPPFANGTPANYLTNLARFSEAGDRLVLDGSAANAVRGIGNPDLVAGHIAVLGTNIDPADLTRGLKSDDDFEVEARFDLMTPGVGQGYGLSLTDNTTGGLPPDQLGDDGVNLFVRADAQGNLRVDFTRFDIPADSVTLHESLAFTPEAGENQIVLRLIHDADEVGVVHAELDLLGGAGGPRTIPFAEIGHIFGSGTAGYAGDNENWTRAQVVAFGPDAYAGVTTLQGTYGSLSVDQNGDFTYTLDNAAANVQALAQGQVAVDSFNVRATDEYGLSNRVVLNVNVIGTGEAPPPVPVDVVGDGQNNVLIGSSLGERFYGDLGADLLIGLDGSDVFDYNALSEGTDTIADFTAGAGGDKLDLQDLLQGYVPGSNPANFVQLQQFQTANGPNTTVAVDADGDGFGFVPIATLQGVGGLSFEDFSTHNLLL